jgi:hypothetical protein
MQGSDVDILSSARHGNQDPDRDRASLSVSVHGFAVPHMSDVQGCAKLRFKCSHAFECKQWKLSCLHPCMTDNEVQKFDAETAPFGRLCVSLDQYILDCLTLCTERSRIRSRLEATAGCKDK